MKVDDGLHEDLLHHMIGIYTFHRIAAQTMLSLPQIVHGIACCCCKWLGKRWTEDALILSWSQIDRHEFTNLFANANVIITVLHDSDHWALLVLLQGHRSLMLFDSLEQVRPDILQAANETIRVLSKTFNADLSMSRANMPVQQEGWSCGHRVILAMQHVLKSLVENGWKELPTTIPETCFRMTKMFRLCLLTDQLEQRNLKVPDPLLEAVAPADNGAHLRRLVQKTKVPRVVLAPTQPQPPQDEVPAFEPPEPPKKRQKLQDTRNTGEKKKVKNLKQQVSDVITAKQRRNQLKALEKQLEQRGFTHNSEFQKQHQRMKLGTKKGHWVDFLMLLSDKSPMPCKACAECRNLIESLEELKDEKEAGAAEPPGTEDEKKEDEEKGDEEKQTEEKQNEKKQIQKKQKQKKQSQEKQKEEQKDAEKDDEKDPEPAEMPEMPVFVEERKRGRPKKGHQWIGLDEYLSKHREGIYEVIDRENQIWRCNLCRMQLKMQRNGLTFFYKHEAKEMHKLKLKMLETGIEQEQVKVEDVAKPCSGTNVMEEDSVLHHLKESIANWVAGGMPFATGDKNGKDSWMQQLSVSFTTRVQGINLKHKMCQSSLCVGCCDLCHHLLNNPNLEVDIKKWSFRLDLVQLAHLTILGTPEAGV